MTDNQVTKDQMIATTASDSRPPTEAIPEQMRRDWIAPQFERIPLTEAMGPAINHIAQDGANLYS